MNLQAVFSLAENPPGMNFLYFLVAADIERERRGLDGIDLHVGPGPADGFRAIDAEYQPEEKAYRVRKIVQGGACLLPSVRSLRVGSGAVVDGWPGPMGKPGVSGYGLIRQAADEGVNVRRLRATPWARRKVADWIKGYAAGRKLVVLTLRTTAYDCGRNSTQPAWLALERRIRDAGYAAVVVPDTEKALTVDAASMATWAALDIEMRAALYEAAHLNMGVNQGAMELWNWLEACRSMVVWQTRGHGGYVKQEPFLTDERQMVVMRDDENPDALWWAFRHMEGIPDGAD